MLKESIITSIMIESNINIVSHIIFNGRYTTIINTRYNLTFAVDMNYLSTSILININIITWEWKSCSIRKVPVSSVCTLCITAALTQISVTLNTVATTDIIPHETDVHIAMVR